MYETDLFIANSYIHGEGVFTKKNIKKGERIMKAITSAKNVTPLGSKVNHLRDSKSNSKLFKNSDGSYDLFAKRDIIENEEITVNYDDTPPFIKKADKNWEITGGCNVM